MKKLGLVIALGILLLAILLFANNVLYVKKAPQTAMSTAAEAIVSNAKSKLTINKKNSKLRVQRITSSNAVELIKTGPDAIGGIGDWFLTNGTICAVISDVAHENELSSKGGVLTDLGFCDRADDHYTTIQDLLDADQQRPMDIERIETESNASSVSVIAYGKRDGVVSKTRYRLDAQHPTQLFISKKVSLLNEKEANFNLYTTFWFNYHSMQPFIYSASDHMLSRGFNNVDFVSRGTSAIPAAAIAADTVILPSPSDAEAPIAYGWQIKSAIKRSGTGAAEEAVYLPSFILSDEEMTVRAILPDNFYLGDGKEIGLLQLPQIPLLSLSTDDSLETEEIIYVGKRADVASVTDQLLADAPLVRGKVKDSKTALQVEYHDGSPLTFVRPDADGSFQFRATLGKYKIRHRGSANRSAEAFITVSNEDVDLGLLTLNSAVKLKLPRNEAMRLIFVGTHGTEDPDFADALTDFTVHDGEVAESAKKVSQVFLAGIESDRQFVDIAPGSYKVYATRGPEYSLSQTDITIKAGQEYELEIEIPQHVVTTPGYIAADLHVHSGGGFDNTFSTQERVRSFVAEHGEVMVSSEHDVPLNFSPHIDALGVSHKITSIPAVEMTSTLPSKKNPYTGGHVNFFPVRPKPHQYRKGMINHEDKRLREVLHAFNHEHPGVVSQLNHARQHLLLSSDLPEDYAEYIDKGGYLNHMGVAGHPYNPEQPLHAHPNSSLIEKDPQTGVRDIDVDAMEVINPSKNHPQDRIIAMRKDWLSFLKQGLHITGTANSDSHHANEQVAVPRNMVAVKNDSVEKFEQKELLDALKQGNVYGTTGPMLDISLSGTEMGQTLLGNKATLNLKVRSAEWIPVNEIKVQVNGEDVKTFAVNDTQDYQVDLEFDKDSFVTVEISGESTAEYKTIYPLLLPYAFSNPIYVDYDSDGQWTAPGL